MDLCRICADAAPGTPLWTNGILPWIGGIFRGEYSQQSLSFLHDELKEVKTHKREFLEKMDAIMPWEQLYELVKPCYYEGARGNKPYDLELMLRIHLLQNLYDLSDEGTRNEIIDSRAFSDFCEVESSNQIPDGDTIGRFRNLLIKNHIHEQFFALVVKTLNIPLPLNTGDADEILDQITEQEI